MKLDLKTYLFIKEISLKDLAKEAGCCYSYLSAVANGHIKPGKKLVRKIEELTGIDISRNKNRNGVQIQPCEGKNPSAGAEGPERG